MYQVQQYRGEYIERQDQANKDGCICYVEHHFNCTSSPAANYTLVITGSNASQTSKNWGRWYAKAVSREFRIPMYGEDGIKVGGFGGRGDANLRYTDMPAILLEPLFASNPQHAQWIRSETGQNRLAQILVESIQRFFQKGGLVGFSVGHKYKRLKPHDRGADVLGGGSEADFAEVVLQKAQTLLEGVEGRQEERTIRVIQGEEVLLSHNLDADAVLNWDPARGILRINEA